MPRVPREVSSNNEGAGDKSYSNGYQEGMANSGNNSQQEVQADHDFVEGYKDGAAYADKWKSKP